MTTVPRLRRPVHLKVLWATVILLAAIGFIASVARGAGVIASVYLTDGPPPELSRIDRGNIRFMAALFRVDPGSEILRDVEEQNRRMLGKFNRVPTVTLLHVVPAALFMLLAPLQFSRRIRSRHRRWHRWSGRALVALALPIGLSGLFFGLVMPFAGLRESSAIALFGALFLFATGRAFVAIRARDVERHREWMIRMFAVAIGVSVVRLVGSVWAAITLQGPDAWFGYSVWTGFGVTVAAAELWIRRTRPGKHSGGGMSPPAGVTLATGAAATTFAK